MLSLNDSFRFRRRTRLDNNGLAGDQYEPSEKKTALDRHRRAAARTSTIRWCGHRDVAASGLQPGPSQAQIPDLLRQYQRGRFAVPAAGESLLPYVRQTIEKRAGSNDHGPAMDAASIHQMHTAHTTVFNDQRRDFRLLDMEVRLALEEPASSASGTAFCRTAPAETRRPARATCSAGGTECPRRR